MSNFYRNQPLDLLHDRVMRGRVVEDEEEIERLRAAMEQAREMLIGRDLYGAERVLGEALEAG